MKENFKELDAVVAEWLEEHKRKRNLNAEKGDKGEDFMELMLSEINGTNIHGFDSDTIIKATAMVRFYCVSLCDCHHQFLFHFCINLCWSDRR